MNETLAFRKLLESLWQRSATLRGFVGLTAIPISALFGPDVVEFTFARWPIVTNWKSDAVNVPICPSALVTRTAAWIGPVSPASVGFVPVIVAGRMEMANGVPEREPVVPIGVPGPCALS